jgi:ketosteroid isomerase-like protein
MGVCVASQRFPYDATLVADLNDLIQLDRDASEAYTVAINSVRGDTLRDALVANRADHRRNAELLAALVRSRGAMAMELPHVTGPFKVIVQAIGGATRRDANVLLALRVVEGQVREQYTRLAAQPWPADVDAVVQTAAAGEERHYRWILESLQDLGAGEDTWAGTVGAAAEAFHKVVATPIEAAAKHLMRVVDEANPFTQRAWTGQASRSSRAEATVVDRYRSALHAVEERGDTEWMVALFASDATLASPLIRAEEGEGSASHFWAEYHRVFATIVTQIDRVSDASGTATLQWTSRGRHATGPEVTFSGVTVLEYRDDRITRLQSFFDPAVLEPASVGGGTVG